MLFRPSPRIAFGWRNVLLRLFGAKLGRKVRIYNSVRVFLPSNLDIGNHCIVGPDVDLYCVAPIVLQDNSMISQYSYLCTATHDYRADNMPLVAKPIIVESEAWICAGVFIGPGLTIGQRAIVGARSVVVQNVASGTIVGGNPARFIKTRL